VIDGRTCARRVCALTTSAFVVSANFWRRVRTPAHVDCLSAGEAAALRRCDWWRIRFRDILDRFTINTDTLRRQQRPHAACLQHVKDRMESKNRNNTSKRSHLYKIQTKRFVRVLGERKRTTDNITERTGLSVGDDMKKTRGREH